VPFFGQILYYTDSESRKLSSSPLIFPRRSSPIIPSLEGYPPRSPFSETLRSASQGFFSPVSFPPSPKGFPKHFRVLPECFSFPHFSSLFLLFFFFQSLPIPAFFKKYDKSPFPPPQSGKKNVTFRVISTQGDPRPFGFLLALLVK